MWLWGEFCLLVSAELNAARNKVHGLMFYHNYFGFNHLIESFSFSDQLSKQWPEKQSDLGLPCLLFCQAFCEFQP